MKPQNYRNLWRSDLCQFFYVFDESSERLITEIGFSCRPRPHTFLCFKIKSVTWWTPLVGRFTRPLARWSFLTHGELLPSRGLQPGQGAGRVRAERRWDGRWRAWKRKITKVCRSFQPSQLGNASGRWLRPRGKGTPLIGFAFCLWDSVKLCNWFKTRLASFFFFFGHLE